jgi:parvulin-like peptidyl-prolyl isomerase
MKPSKLLLPLVSLAVVASLARAEIVERVVARVNGDIVTLSEFEARQFAAVQQAKVPQAQVETYLRENNARLLQEAIDDMLILQRGEELGIRLRPEYVQEVIEGIKKENNIADDNQLQQQLRREGMTIDDLKRNIERSIVRRQVLTRDLEAKATVNEAEARAEYEHNKDAYTRKASVHLHEIVVPDGEQARALVARARAGEDFAALARANSTAPTRDAGGDLGVLQRGEMNAALEAVAFGLDEGAVSEPLPAESGYRILRVTDKKAGSVAAFAEVKDEIIQRLSQERATKAYDAYVEGLRKTAVTQTMVTEVPLQLSLPATGTSLVPTAGNPTAATAAPADPDAEIVITPQARPERVAPPAAPATGTPAAPVPQPSPSPQPPIG